VADALKREQQSGSAGIHAVPVKPGFGAVLDVKVTRMARAKLVLFVIPLVVAIFGSEVTAQAPNVDSPSWVMDLKTLGYPVHPTENFSKTFGVPPTTLAFADPEHLVATFISPDLGVPSEREGRPDSFRLRLHAIVFDSRTGKVGTKRDWSTPNPNDGVITAHNGIVVIRAGDRLTQYSTTLEALKERDTAPNHGANEGLFRAFSSTTGRFVLLEFLRGSGREYAWMAADDLEIVHSFSDNISPVSISDKEIVGWRRVTSRESEFVIQRPDEPGRAIPLSKYLSKVIFVNQDTLVIEAGYSPMLLIQRDGALIETITPHTHDSFSRVTPSADGRRLAFTGSSIRNRWEILSPHEQWEYVQRVIVYDISAHTFICDLKVRHSAKNQEFHLALSPNGSMLAFFDGESLKVYQLPVATEPHP
jgi:hypothetical protein